MHCSYCFLAYHVSIIPSIRFNTMFSIVQYSKYQSFPVIGVYYSNASLSVCHPTKIFRFLIKTNSLLSFKILVYLSSIFSFIMNYYQKKNYIALICIVTYAERIFHEMCVCVCLFASDRNVAYTIIFLNHLFSLQPRK